MAKKKTSAKRGAKTRARSTRTGAAKKSTRTAASKSQVKMCALEAAAKVLKQTGRPMNCSQLVAAMARKGYWRSPRGKTPERTLSAALRREIQNRGEEARFRIADPGQFVLSK